MDKRESVADMMNNGQVFGLWISWGISDCGTPFIGAVSAAGPDYLVVDHAKVYHPRTGLMEVGEMRIDDVASTHLFDPKADVPVYVPTSLSHPPNILVLEPDRPNASVLLAKWAWQEVDTTMPDGSPITHYEVGMQVETTPTWIRYQWCTPPLTEIVASEVRPGDLIGYTTPVQDALIALERAE